MKFRYSLILVLFVFISSCKTVSKPATPPVVKAKQEIPQREHTIQALLWQQNAAEYKALCHQTYNIAKLRLDELLKKEYNKPVAIVTDIDETILDNSPYNARMVQTDQSYTRDTWIAWGKEAKAKAIPGAVTFFKYATSKGVVIYYLSNRYHIQQPETIENLKKVGFPKVDKAHVLLRTTTSAKKPRRDLIEKTHQIIMLFGDNLSDFSEEFDKQPTIKRNALVNKMQQNFGKKFFVLPNPMYGDWESKGIYEGSYKWTAKQKDSIRRVKLRAN